MHWFVAKFLQEFAFNHMISYCWKTFFGFVMNDTIRWTPFFSHLKERECLSSLNQPKQKISLPPQYRAYISAKDLTTSCFYQNYLKSPRKHPSSFFYDHLHLKNMTCLKVEGYFSNWKKSFDFRLTQLPLLRLRPFFQWRLCRGQHLHCPPKRIRQIFLLLSLN